MKKQDYKVVVNNEDNFGISIDAYERVCRYLLQRYYEGCEYYESSGVFESIDRGTGRKRLFVKSTEA